MRLFILLIAILLSNISCRIATVEQQNLSCKVCSEVLNLSTFQGAVLEAYTHIQFNDDWRSADSLLRSTIQRFKSSLIIDSLVYFSCAYLTLPELSGNNLLFTKELVMELERSASSVKNPQLQAILHFALNHYYYHTFDALKSFNHAHKLVSLNAMEAGDMKVLEHIALGRAHERAIDYKSALKNFLEGYYIAEEIQITFYRSFILGVLSDFYNRNNLHEKAYEYKLVSLDLLANDSISYYFSLLHKLEYVRKINKDGTFNLSEFKEVVNYSKRFSIKRLSVYAFAFLRTSFLDANKAPELYKLYSEQYPEELEQFKIIDSDNYFKFMAAYHEFSGKPDSAEYYFQKVIKAYSQSNAGFGNIYSLYLRYGDFKVRMGDQKLALKAYLLSFEAVNHLNNTKHQLIAAKKLKDIYVASNQGNEAVQFIQIFHSLQDRADSLQHDRDIVKMELENGAQILQLQKRLETEQLHKVHQNQYNLIAVFIGLVLFILLAAVQLHVPIWIIRTLGFLFFIFLFEFFIIKLDKQIHHLTHEVPWKLFTLKVVLFSMLLPLHHWLEKIVVHYLVEKRASGGRLIKFNFQIISDWFQKWNKPG
ncbi:MAG: hypothetical protein IPM92_16020 [Saprospiraceae bacterium]|nr:hypothetical protein [Saprospiraceae bacterium]